MSKRRTSRHRSRPRPSQHVLELRVSSPRILWFGVLRGLWRATRLALVLAVIGGAIWGAGIGLKHLFIDNEEFRLQVIELNPNGAIDEKDLVELGEIDLRGSVFEIGTTELRRRLEARDDIISAKVERRLPGTLWVEVKDRKPVAWLHCEERGMPGRDLERGRLLDSDGVLIRCSEIQWARAEALPVIEMAAVGGDPLELGEAAADPQLRRALKLVQTFHEKIPADAGWSVDRLRVVNEWSMEAVTTDGERATFGLADQERQVADLVLLKAHIAGQGGRIAEVNLIPERNIPVRLEGEPAPRAIPVEWPENAGEVPQAVLTRPEIRAPQANRLDRDVRAILNRN